MTTEREHADLEREVERLREQMESLRQERNAAVAELDVARRVLPVMTSAGQSYMEERDALRARLAEAEKLMRQIQLQPDIATSNTCPRCADDLGPGNALPEHQPLCAVHAFLAQSKEEGR